tara:strand:+ start:894 stop:1157 length:264 start_codon:yes stop_codon:yes gene_type:complete
MNPTNGKGSEKLHARTQLPHDKMQANWNGAFKSKDQFELIKKGQGINGVIQNKCNYCGWLGSDHYAHNDYQHTNCREERFEHKCKAK